MTTRRQSAEAGASGASVTVTLGLAPIAGNLLVAAVIERSAGGRAPTPAGWALADDAAGGGHWATMFYRVAEAGDPAALTMTLNSPHDSYGWMAEYEDAGLFQAAAVNETQVGTALSVGPLVVDADDSLAVAAFVQNANLPAYTPAGGFTTIQTGECTAGGGVAPTGLGVDNLAVPAGALTVSVTSADGGGWGGVLAVFGPPAALGAGFAGEPGGGIW
jgi:hypothetical protein